MVDTNGSSYRRIYSISYTILLIRSMILENRAYNNERATLVCWLISYYNPELAIEGMLEIVHTIRIH